MKKKNASYFSNIYVHLTHALYKLYQQKFTASPCCFMQWQAGSENLIIFRRMLKDHDAKASGYFLSIKT